MSLSYSVYTGPVLMVYTPSGAHDWWMGFSGRVPGVADVLCEAAENVKTQNEKTIWLRPNQSVGENSFWFNVEVGTSKLSGVWLPDSDQQAHIWKLSRAQAVSDFSLSQPYKDVLVKIMEDLPEGSVALSEFVTMLEVH